MGNDKSDYDSVIAELRELVRDAHAFMKDFARERRAAQQEIETLKVLIHGIIHEDIKEVLNEKMEVTKKALGKKMEESVKAIDAEFLEIRDIMMGETKKNKRREDTVTLREAAQATADGFYVRSVERVEKFADREIL